MWLLEGVRRSLGGQHLRVGLAADRLFVAPGGGSAMACRERIVAAAEDGAAWRPALRALAEEIAAADGLRRLEVVLGGCHVRWKLIELPRGLKKATDRDAVAAHHFQDSLGNEARHWRIQIVAQPSGWPAPACAVDGRLLDELDAVCRDAKLSPARVQPYFAAAFDHWRARISGDTFWFAVQDGESLCVGLLRGGRWAGLNTRPANGDGGEQIASMQAQLAIPAGIDVGAVPLHLVALDAAGVVGANRLAPPPQWHASAVRCRMAFGL